MYRSAPLEKFLADLSARTPTPGGGSTSALAGALGAAQACMCAAFTTQHEKFKAVEPEARQLLGQFEALRETLLALLERDLQAYQDLAAARKLPKETDQQQQARAARIAAAQEHATQVPEAILEGARQGQELLGPLLRICNPNLLSDITVAAYLLEACARGACAQVCANLCGPKAGSLAPARRRAAREKARACQLRCAELDQIVMHSLGVEDDTAGGGRMAAAGKGDG